METHLFQDTQFVVEKKVGEGASSSVYLAKHARSFETSIVKILPRKSSRYFWREKRALEKIQDFQNVIRLKKAVHGTDYAYLFLERGATDLYELCQSPLSQQQSPNQQQQQLLPPSPPPFRFSEDFCRPLFKQMMNGLLSAHKVGVCHHDVKLENFLVGVDGQVKLIDFGFSLYIAEDRDWFEPQATTPTIRGQYSAGSPAYSSQQVLLKLSHNPQKTDIFGLGVCLFRLLCGKFPFCDPEVDTLDILKQNLERDLLEFPPELSFDVRELLRGMLSRTENDRFDWFRISNHPWLAIRP